MKYQMPEPDSIRTYGNPYAEGYTATQVQAAYTAGRAAGLEAAAQTCMDLAVTDCGDSNLTRHECADAIRNLAKETPCA